ncbi:type II 3-dehydroquinate dehydratase [Entomomonas sp. E2T0]|uniref:type II 3-dehydroquinate dehydratase n=1 Tax=Entomomonas sp. E2T0 TaxID=2930213 RepID=UPI0022282666|nr:type II 3-dehydroquinate dehydratase [Entomomonas sp. E2T0]UYZ83940.1 type II 3-dehydroquinate dehydratase [Entomomonas sp. E2T0]
MTKVANILLINGPNLNLLGLREPNTYGKQTLPELIAHLEQVAKTLQINISHTQHNGEGQIVDAIHAAKETQQGIIINAGAYTHTSIAIRDALAGVTIPFIEVHISNVYKREPFRHYSYLSDQAIGVIAGLGVYGYEAALNFFNQYFME